MPRASFFASECRNSAFRLVLGGSRLAYVLRGRRGGGLQVDGRRRGADEGYGDCEGDGGVGSRRHAEPRGAGEDGRVQRGARQGWDHARGEGLHPTSKGVRIRFPEGTVIDGPFAETKELIAGYWLWQVGSVQEAVDWLQRSPFREFPAHEVEIRPVFEADDFGEAFTPELREQEERIMAEAARLRGTAASS